MIAPVKVGDLVYVHRWPCCGAALGAVWAVSRMIALSDVHCRHCLALQMRGVITLAVSPEGRCAPVDWVRRIPPLSELESRVDRVPVAA